MTDEETAERGVRSVSAWGSGPKQTAPDHVQEAQADVHEGKSELCSLHFTEDTRFPTTSGALGGVSGLNLGNLMGGS